MTRRSWFGRRADDEVAREVREELESHLAQRVSDNLARGLSPVDARREAERRFGSVPAAAAEGLRLRRRALSTRRALLVDLRQALLAMARAPGVAAAGALVTAVGLGTAFGAWWLADALLFKPPAGLRQPSELYSVLDSLDGLHPMMLSYRSFSALERAAPPGSAFAWGRRDLQVVHAAARRVWPAAMVSGAYFDAIGARAEAGRLLGPDDARRRRRAAVVSARMARALAARTSDLPGQSVIVNGQPFDIVGVAESGFLGVEAGQPVDLWLPLEVEPDVSSLSIFPDGRRVRGFNEANVGWLRGAARIRPGHTVTEIGTAMTAVLRAEPQRPDVASTRRALLADRVWLSPWPTERTRLRDVTLPLVAAAGLTLVLMSACLGSLFAARVADRSRELAVRAALGAGRARLVRLAIFEIALVGALGAALAIPLAGAVLGAAGTVALTPTVTIADAVTAIDGRGIASMSIIALAALSLAAIAPLAILARMPIGVHRASMRVSSGGHVFRRLLIAIQVGAACALLSGATMLGRSVAHLRGQPLGYHPDGVAFVEIEPSGAGLTEPERTALIPRLLDARSPEASVALVDEPPFGGQSMLFVKADDAAITKTFPVPTTRIIGPYFEVLEMRLLAGRPFNRSDAGRAVVIVSEPLAAAYWPGAAAVGRFVRVGGDGGTRHEVIGVVAGLRDVSLRREPSQRLYLPLDANAERLTVIARGPSARELRETLARRVEALDPRLVQVRGGTLDDLLRRTLEQRVAFRTVAATIGGGSLLVVTIAVWGLSNGTLRRRWREFGVRQAMGATPLGIGWIAAGDAGFVAAAGGCGGALAGWQFGRILQSWLFGVAPSDPIALAAATAIVALAAGAGAIRPTCRAMRVDLTHLLREE